jgi:molybdenum cofactor biosynthesis protein A
VKSGTLYDNHGRPLTYARIAVTDRCNLRCSYCMPESGIRYLPKKELLTYEEIQRLVKILASMGITKLRLTGGEPFVRKDFMQLLHSLVDISGVEQVHLTTNGVLTGQYIPQLKDLGIGSINLSLDTLDENRFHLITRRDEFTPVMNTLELLIKHAIPTKINAVVMADKNIEDIIPLIELTRQHPISVRFIEEMPFNGEGNHYTSLQWTYARITEYIREHYPSLIKIADPQNSTAYHYQVPGYKGNIGIIAAFSRTFCGSCNRIRITAKGELKTCLYDDGVLNIRNIMRAHQNDIIIKNALLQAFANRPKDGFEAELKRRTALPATESMSTIGG